MTTTPPENGTPSAERTPVGRVQHWLDVRFRTPAAVYGLIVYTAFILIGDDPGDTIWDVLVTAIGTLCVFFIAHVFAHTLTGKHDRTRDSFIYSVRHASGMLYASIPTSVVLIVAALDDVPVAEAVWYAMTVAIVTLGILGYAAYAKPGIAIGVRILAAIGTAALGSLVIALEYVFH